jgi:hypothetical protein
MDVSSSCFSKATVYSGRCCCCKPLIHFVVPREVVLCKEVFLYLGVRVLSLIEKRVLRLLVSGHCHASPHSVPIIPFEVEYAITHAVLSCSPITVYIFLVDRLLMGYVLLRVQTEFLIISF